MSHLDGCVWRPAAFIGLPRSFLSPGTPLALGAGNPELTVRLVPVLFVVLAAILGCESGTAFEVEIAEASDTLGSADAPFLLRAGVDETGRNQWITATIGVFCGDVSHAATVWNHDDGFGCLADELEGVSVPARAWLQLAPVEWDLVALCVLRPDQWGVVRLDDVQPAEVLDTADTADTAESSDTADTADLSDTAGTADADTGLDSDGLAIVPDDAWPRSEGVVTWARDGSPCGGFATGTLDFPG